MNSLPVVYVIDDDSSAARLLEKILESRYVSASFHSAEDCLLAIAERLPDLLLLDVGLPGIDGFALCRQLKEDARTATVPILFVSGRVDIESRLAAYDCGGEDFILKPFDVREVERKIERSLQARAGRSELSERLNDAETLTSLILSNLDEYAVLVNYLRALNSCTDVAGLIELTHRLLRGFGLKGVVQVRGNDGVHTADAAGNCTPVMLSVMQHLQTLERIFEFRNHGVYNFLRITLMVDNMPLDDPERCGRLRDHLAIAVETADARAWSLEIARTTAHSVDALNEMVQQLHAAMQQQALRYDQAAQAGAILMRELDQEMRAAVSYLAMTEIQEESMLELVQNKARQLVAAYDVDNGNSQLLASLNNRLTSTAAALTKLR